VRLEWTASAKRDLQDIIDYIWLDNPQATRRMNTRFRAVARLLTHSPYSGKLGAVAGTREFVAHSNYKIVYQVTGETVSIMALVHTSRHWPIEPGGD
jgi:addiction module RelE/StbE family toxin